MRNWFPIISQIYEFLSKRIFLQITFSIIYFNHNIFFERLDFEDGRIVFDILLINLKKYLV